VVFYNNWTEKNYRYRCATDDFCQICHCRRGYWHYRDCTREECKLDGFHTFGTFGNSTYMLGQQRITWVAAKQACIDAGGHLASIESDEEFDAIKSWFNAAPLRMGDTDWWIGGYSRGQQHLPMDFKSPMLRSGTAYDKTPFHWVSGPEILFNSSHFAGNTWLTLPYPKCLVLLPYRTNGAENLWHSRRCLQENYYLCEKSN